MLGGAAAEEGVVPPFIARLVTGVHGAPVLDLVTEEFAHAHGGKLSQSTVEEAAHIT